MNKMFVSTQSNLLRGMPRTQDTVHYKHKLSFNAGLAVPFMCHLIYPGTTVQMDLHTITRMATPVNPIMDDIYQDFHFFFVPLRILYDRAVEQGVASGTWDEFITYSDWDDVSNLRLPTIQISQHANVNITPGTLGHYLGLPLGTYDNSHSNYISLMQVFAYAEIWNEYFRDENYQAKISVLPEIDFEYATDNSTPREGSELEIITYFDPCMYVNEFHDPYTSVLPSPQKGPEATISLGELAPVISGELDNNIVFTHNLVFKRVGSPDFYYGNGQLGYVSEAIAGGLNTPATLASVGSLSSVPMETPKFVPANLYADLSKATATTINQLRESIVLQHYLETLARSGSRYNEWLLGFFNVVSPDARLQRPEYIVGKRVPINISEVLQTSGEAVNDTVLGTAGAVSRTVNTNKNLFTYTAVEHGFLMCISCVRHSLSYSQGLSRDFTNVEALDFYNPIFNGIGEQPIYTREILLKTGNIGNIKRSQYSGDNLFNKNFGSDATILGYQEPFFDVFYKQSRASGLLDPVGARSLDTWTLTKAFSSDVNGANIRRADDVTIDRVIRVQNEDQFWGDYYFDMTITAVKPLKSLPGLDRI